MQLSDSSDDSNDDDRTAFVDARAHRVQQRYPTSNFAVESQSWAASAMNLDYTHNFDWCGLPIIQFPQDIVALQEIIWRTKPDVIIETGIARGGSLIFHASMLLLLDAEQGIDSAQGHSVPRRRVIGIDIDIREHNRAAIDGHFLRPYIELVEGSSTDGAVVAAVRNLLPTEARCMVILDSLHTAEHVEGELEAFGPLVSSGCYLVVLDTFVESLPEYLSSQRPWGSGNSPATALERWLPRHPEFSIDHHTDVKLGVTCAPGGYLRRL